MNPRISISCLALWLLGSTLIAQNSAPSSGKDLRMIEVEGKFLRATESEMADALRNVGVVDGVLHADTLEKVLNSLKEKGVIIYSNPRAVTVSSKRASVRAVRGFRYPTEYANKENLPGKSIPISFEERNIGVSFSFEPMVGPSNLINLFVEPDVTAFLGLIDYSGQGFVEGAGWNDLLKAPLREGGVWQPVFSSFSISTNVALNSGETVLLGGMADELSSPKLEAQISKEPKGDGRLNYVFVTARLVANK